MTTGSIAGSVEFEVEGVALPVADVERALGTEFVPAREDDEALYYNGGPVLGLKFTLELVFRGDGYACELTYRTENVLWSAEGEVVDIDFHIAALLATGGIEARRVKPPV